MANNTEHLKKHEIPGRIAVVSSNGGLPKIAVTTKFSAAEIYPLGAHVTGFQKNGESPLLFLSGKSHFDTSHSIRGGVPVIYPWFGQHEGVDQHGFARVHEWELAGTAAAPDGSVKLNFNLPDSASVKAGWPAAKVNFIVTVGDKLTMELIVTNPTDQEFAFEGCLHTYFEIGDINRTSIAGLKGIHYLDKTDNLARKLESGDAIKINSEVDRVYLNTTGAVEIRDAKLQRKIRVEKSGSASTVVWNPWIDKAKAMPDFGDEEYKQMVCVESGNVSENKITLAPGKSSSLKVILSSQPI